MIAVDTNILVHAHRRDTSFHTAAAACIRELAESPAPWAICLHGLVEFYGVVTQPRLWKLPSTPQEASEQIAAWRESPSLRVLGDRADVIDRTLELARKGAVRGGMIHDARIAAVCLEHGIRELWTIDRDFSRFDGLRIRNPLQRG